MIAQRPFQFFTLGKWMCRRGSRFARFQSTESTLTVDHLVVGGGVVGLAVAHQLLSHYRHPGSNSMSKNQKDGDSDERLFRVLVVDRNQYVAEEQSSRNSEVIHGNSYSRSISLIFMNFSGTLLSTRVAQDTSMY